MALTFCRCRYPRRSRQAPHRGRRTDVRPNAPSSPPIPSTCLISRGAGFASPSCRPSRLAPRVFGRQRRPCGPSLRSSRPFGGVAVDQLHRIEIAGDRGLGLLVGGVDQPHDEEEAHHRRHEVGKGDLPDAAMVAFVMVAGLRRTMMISCLASPARQCSCQDLRQRRRPFGKPRLEQIAVDGDGQVEAGRLDKVELAGASPSAALSDSNSDCGPRTSMRTASRSATAARIGAARLSRRALLQFVAQEAAEDAGSGGAARSPTLPSISSSRAAIVAPARRRSGAAMPRSRRRGLALRLERGVDGHAPGRFERRLGLRDPRRSSASMSAGRRRAGLRLGMAAAAAGRRRCAACAEIRQERRKAAPPSSTSCLLCAHLRRICAVRSSLRSTMRASRSCGAGRIFWRRSSSGVGSGRLPGRRGRRRVRRWRLGGRQRRCTSSKLGPARPASALP